jgi:hypothetical protein
MFAKLLLQKLKYILVSRQKLILSVQIQHRDSYEEKLVYVSVVNYIKYHSEFIKCN